MATCVREGLIGLVMVTVLTVAACSQQDPAPATTTAATTTSTSTIPSPSSTTQADPQLSHSEAAVRDFSHIVDSLAADPQTSLDELTTISRGQTLNTARDLLTNQRRQGYKQTGTVSIVSSQAKPAGEGKVTVDACLDVSKTDLLDKGGKSVVSKDREPRVRYTYVVQQAKDGKFYVLQDKAVGTC
jgi:hypothetical protein